MRAASERRVDPLSTRLMHVDPRLGTLVDGRADALLGLLRPGDALVINDAATLPASLLGATASGAPVEARLAGPGPGRFWRAVLFGAGDWRTRTEDREPPPALRPGDEIRFDGLSAAVARVDPQSPRLVELDFRARGGQLWRALYRAGRPVQYAHTHAPLAPWDVQTAYASRPWAAEAPSAGYAFSWDLLLGLRRRGVAVARVTHAAGLSSTGDEALDARLPFAERYEVPEEAVRAVEAARAAGGRVVAAGTTVTRALESAAAEGGGRLVAACGVTELTLGPGTERRVVDGILTGLHERGTSHFALLEAFAPAALLERANGLAEARGYLGHEFGDLMLILG